MTVPLETQNNHKAAIETADGKSCVADKVLSENRGAEQGTAPKRQSDSCNNEKHLPQLTLHQDVPQAGKGTALTLGLITGEETNSHHLSRVHAYFNSQALVDFMQTKNAVERRDADAAFKAKYGADLEDVARRQLKGHPDQLQTVVNALHRQDGDIVAQHAADLEAILASPGKNQAGDKHLRDIFATSTGEDLRRMDQIFSSKSRQNDFAHPGSDSTNAPHSMLDAINKSNNVSEGTKAALELLKNGNDRRSDDDSLKLARLALKEKDLDLFAHAMQPESARSRFWAGGGQGEILAALGDTKMVRGGHTVHLENPEARRALDIARTGRTTAVTEIKDHTWQTDPLPSFTLNKSAVDFSLSRLSEDERKQYVAGKSLAEHPERALTGLTEVEKQKAQSYYKELHGTLSVIGNSTDMVKWEDQIATKGGSFISDLAAHRGTIYNDSAAEIKKEITGMNKKQWEDAREHPERREELEKMLKSLGQDRRATYDMMSTFDAMVSAQAKPGQTQWAAAEEAGRGPLEKSLKEAHNQFFGSAEATRDALLHMPLSDQDRYRQDRNFRQTLDKKVNSIISNQEQRDAVHRMLNQVRSSEKPSLDLAGKIAFESDAVKAIHTVQEAFTKDPALLTRLTQPVSDGEKNVARDFKNSLNNVLVPGLSHPLTDYRSYGDDLLKTGRVPLEKMIELSKAAPLKGSFSHDLPAMIQDLAKATPEERGRFLSASESGRAYRRHIISGLSVEQTTVLMAVATQGEVKPEDTIRATLLSSSNSTTIAATAKDLDADQIGGIKARYATKYDSDLEHDLLSRTYDDDRVTIKRHLAQQLGADEQAELARNEGRQLRTGLAAALTDKVSGTGPQADQTVRELNSQIGLYRQAAATGKAADAEQTLLSSSVETAQKAYDNHINAQESMGDTVADTAIGAIAIGSAVSSVGLTLPAVSLYIGAGTTARVSTSMLTHHNSDLVREGIIGAAETAGAMLGPAEMPLLGKLGMVPVQKAVSRSMEGSALAHLASPEIIANVNEALQPVAREAIANYSKIGQPEVKDALKPVLAALGKSAPGHELVASLSRNLQEEIEAAGSAKHFVISQGLTVTAVSAATTMQTLAEDLPAATPASQLGNDLGTSSKDAVVYSAAFDAALLAGAPLGKILSRIHSSAAAPHRTPHQPHALHQTDAGEELSHKSGGTHIPPGMLLLLVPESSDDGADDKKDKKGGGKKKGGEEGQPGPGNERAKSSDPAARDKDGEDEVEEE
jgi:hypothetical protein